MCGYKLVYFIYTSFTLKMEQKRRKYKGTKTEDGVGNFGVYLTKTNFKAFKLAALNHKAYGKVADKLT